MESPSYFFIRLEQVVCQTVDVAYSPETIEMCRKADKFRELVVNTALDAVEKQMLERNDIVSRDFKILKKVKCKGNEPAFMTINVANLKNSLNSKGYQGVPEAQNESETQKRQRGNQDFTPKLYKEFMQSQKNFQQEKETESKEDAEKNQEDNEQNEEGRADGSVLNRAIEAPKYKITYSYHTEYEARLFSF